VNAFVAGTQSADQAGTHWAEVDSVNGCF
jgi:hypothetical protein